MAAPEPFGCDQRHGADACRGRGGPAGGRALWPDQRIEHRTVWTTRQRPAKHQPALRAVHEAECYYHDPLACLHSITPSAVFQKARHILAPGDNPFFTGRHFLIVQNAVARWRQLSIGPALSFCEKDKLWVMLKLFLCVPCCSPAPRFGPPPWKLKGQASVTGTILEEKKDQIVIDIGYTVLTIPKSQVVKCSMRTPRPSKP